MFIRKGFVTNSSSTSYVCYGMLFDCDDTEKAVTKATGKSISENDGDDLYIEMEKLMRKVNKKTSPVLMTIASEDLYFLLYIRESYLWVGDGGVDKLEKEEWLKLLTMNKEDKWNALLEKARIKLGLRENKAEWKIALKVPYY
jgi:hypothetical protein